MDDNNKTKSFLERMKQKAQEQNSYGGDAKPTKAQMDATVCSNCGAGRAQDDGLTKCAYCGFEFIKVELTEGLYISKKDNSRP
ncbi:MAG: hypothetical protein QM660_01040 [Dysgonomonas sp.]